MQIACNEHYSKHDSSSRANRDTLSNFDSSRRPCSKHDLPRISTERGVQIDDIEQEQKRASSVRINPNFAQISLHQAAFLCHNIHQSSTCQELSDFSKPAPVVLPQNIEPQSNPSDRQGNFDK
jgi:hypothetical protein